jgi:hypothetical protein
MRLALALGVALCISNLPASLSAQDGGATAADTAELPDWSGIWVSEGPEYGITGFSFGQEPPLLNVMNPDVPWNDVGQPIRDAAAEFVMTGSNKADGWGYPLMMGGPPPLQFLITSGETIILNTYRDLRHIYTDGRDHLDEDVRWPTVWGDSIGHWEGDTLVIETVGVEEPVRYFWINQTFSRNAVYHERIRMIAPDRIENVMTVTDPERLERPWTATIYYRPAPYIDRLIHDTYTNDRSEVDESGLFIILPPEDESGD